MSRITNLGGCTWDMSNLSRPRGTILKNGGCNMLFVHMILDLLQVNEIQRDLVHGIEVEFLRLKRSALDRARVQNAEVDAAVKKLQSAFLDEVLLQDGDCSLM